MPKSRFLILLIISGVIALSSFAGTKVYRYLNDPFQLYEGAWQGDGTLFIGDKKIHSVAIMLVENGQIRLSVNNRYGDFNYTYDGTLKIRKHEHISAHFDIIDRQVRGLEEFVQNTHIDIPMGGNLLRLNAWRLDEGRLFIDVEQSNNLDVSYILTKKSDG
ncbi:hypothetical protein ACOMICROBIO_GDFFDHBD_03224 [Vibrio sp. B1REV9]|uniref:hypothetical protein n=1 Tax=Vibrio sp. B1REV9 TaxID=2751179 RepID=UPI001B16F6C1|nr:hypothetical protein [Vibrio sp. B1REV9]CAE6944035.1 hypothetical protein ACOMICROBIO_GDFFDHBD_03224 [Vibrio sp. B1REV9]